MDTITIGEGTVVHPTALILGCVSIGRNTIIHGCSVIGDDGFTYNNWQKGIPVKKDQNYGVVIGDNVELHALSSIQRGSYRDTVIGNHVKIDYHVHIGHNSMVGDYTLIAAGAIFGGSVVVGKRCFIGLNCTLRQHVTVGDNCIIGMGSVVVFDIPANSVAVGNPAKVIRQRRDDE